MELSGFIIQVWSRYPVADNNCKDTNKREQKANKFEFCRARVSKAKPKIRISESKKQINLNFTGRECLSQSQRYG